MFLCCLTERLSLHYSRIGPPLRQVPCLLIPRGTFRWMSPSYKWWLWSWREEGSCNWGFQLFSLLGDGASAVCKWLLSVSFELDASESRAASRSKGRPWLICRKINCNAVWGLQHVCSVSAVKLIIFWIYVPQLWHSSFSDGRHIKQALLCFWRFLLHQLLCHVAAQSHCWLHAV